MTFSKQMKYFDKKSIFEVVTQIELKLQPVGEINLAPGTNNADEERADIRVKGLHRELQNTFIDVRITNISAKSYLHILPKEALKKAEDEKERQYKDRIQKVENANFALMIFSSNGARAPQTKNLLAKLITKLALKKKEPRSIIANRITTQLSFIFLKQSLVCLRGNRTPTITE